MKKLYISLILLALACAMAAQANGNLQQIGEKAILHVWGDHNQRGFAQGYLLGPQIMDVFDQFYYVSVAWNSPVNYAFLMDYYQQHFESDPRLESEAAGLIAGLQEAGTSLHHAGLGRDLTAADVMLSNAFLDMMLVRSAFTDDDLELGCSSLASWGVSTQQDSLLAGNAVITRFLDWTQTNVLIDNPLLTVHHPSEPDEQDWISIGFPGLLGGLTAISEAGVWASLNVGNDHYATDLQGLDPVMADLRRGIERVDLDGSGATNALDVCAAISAGNHHSGTIIHTLSEIGGERINIAAETNNSGTALRHYDQNGSLPGNHLAATNHFRLLAYPTCCTRYNAIIDSLPANPDMTAKRQWNLLSGAAGMETNLAAVQYVPSTGAIIWSSATLSQPAYQRPALSFTISELFSYTVDASDELIPPARPSVSCYPNPATTGGEINLKGPAGLDRVELFNLRGQQVFSQTLAAGRSQHSLRLPQLRTGLYLLRISGPRGSFARKLVITE